ncbi:MAG: hypothetical protein H8E14_09235 [Candidatus Marinimicrobia bacterium]|nr:hypothetical protein [Candidatus Neomarinimicrobiota bacterium]
MKIEQIIEILNGELLSGEESIKDDVKMACGCDLMSDVLSYIKSDSTILLTGLTAPQVIYTSDTADIKTICFVRGKRPGSNLIKLAQQRGMILMCVDLPMFEACGRLYKAGLKGCSEHAR